ncbi:Hypothetical protein GSB_152455, partial [Giardia duodenalis]
VLIVDWGSTFTNCNPSGNTPYLQGDTCVSADGCMDEGECYIGSSNPSSLVCKPCSAIASCSTYSLGIIYTKCEADKIVKAGNGATPCVMEEECTGARCLHR